MSGKLMTVVFSPTFLREARAVGLTEYDIEDIVDAVALDPRRGEVIQGTGGVRKFRWAMKGRGKSGGARIIHYHGGDDIPVFRLTVYGKGHKANLSQAEKSALRKAIPEMARAYRVRSR